ncbi:MAG: anthranilate phosphoribosyltransferase [Methanoregulaceae archaeon]|nr:anthranilate phosphoribosyltransferase [Methanoregulaceae archaeon]
MKAALARLAGGDDLSPVLAEEAMEMVASGRATDAQIASFITALHLKGESSDEMAAFARVLDRHALKIRPWLQGPLVDTCGTGGDGSGTFNISTAAAIVAAGAGVPIVKHGNRKASSSSGSADVLEALGVRVDLPPQEVCSIIEEVGIGFLFAPVFHPALKHAAKARSELGFASVFNLLGPLLNPSGAGARLCGVYDPGLVLKFARAFQSLDTEHAMVVHGDGIDEITVSGVTRVAEIRQGEIHEYTINPGMFGIPLSPPSSLAGDSPAGNAALIRGVLSGKQGPARDVVVLNAGAAIYLGGKAGNLAEGISLAEKAIDTGQASEKLEELVKATGGKP